jgi:hypothetical protein
MSLEVDMSELPPGVVEEFRKGRHAREVKTLLQAPRLQDMAARAHNMDHRSIDGLGRLRMVVTPDAFHYWGRRLGYECWRDKQFLAEFERDNPNVRVKCGGTKIQVGYRASEQMKAKYPAKGIIAVGKYANLTETA